MDTASSPELSVNNTHRFGELIHTILLTSICGCILKITYIEKFMHQIYFTD